MKYKFLSILLLSLPPISCTHSVHQVHVSDFATTGIQGDRKIEAKAEQKEIFGFAMDADYAQRAYRLLMEQCPHGMIHGITSRHWTSHGFLSSTNKLHVKAYCKQNS